MSDTVKLNQWSVKVSGDNCPKPIFTPLSASAEAALAIAHQMYGSNISAIVDEGVIRHTLSHEDMHIANNRWCAGCGEWLTKDGHGHEEGCPRT